MADSNSPRKFALFGGEEYYARGGMCDLVSTHETLDEAIADAKRRACGHNPDDFAWWQVVEIENFCVVEQSNRCPYGSSDRWLSWTKNEKEIAMADGFRGVPGVPEGWELVRITDCPKSGEFAVERPNRVVRVTDPNMWGLVVIVRKIEQPKRYRPFANAEEFKPHRNRWWRYKTESKATAHPPRAYGDLGWLTDSWGRLFDQIVFDDGSPFGVEVIDGE